jgi:hypothetical protein
MKPKASPASPTPSLSQPSVTRGEIPLHTSTIPVLDIDAPLKIHTVKIIQTEEPQLPRQEKKGILLFIIGTIFSLFIIAWSIVFAYFYFKTPSQISVGAIQQSSTQSPTQQPTKTPKPTFKNDDITFEVLNASGKSGEAAKYGKLLENKNYKINLLGNAPSQSGSTIFISDTLDFQKDSLLANLKTDFPNASYSGTLTDSPNLIRIIIGK